MKFVKCQEYDTHFFIYIARQQLKHSPNEMGWRVNMGINYSVIAAWWLYAARW